MQAIIFLILLEASLPGAPSSPFKATVSISPEQVRPGDRAELRIDCQVLPGWHVYSPDFKGTGIPTQLKLDEGPILAEGALKFPAPKSYRDQALGEEVRTLEGTFQISQLLRVSGEAPPGKVKVSGQLLYQTCSETVCNPPVTLPVAAELEVLSSKGEVKPSEPKDLKEPGTSKPEERGQATPEEKKPSSQGESFRISLEPEVVQRGGTAELVLTYQLPPGNQIYAPDEEKDLALAVEVDRRYATLQGDPSFPAPRAIEEGGISRRILAGEGEIRFPIRFTKDIPLKAASLSVKVHYVSEPGSPVELEIGVPLEFSGGWLGLILFAFLAGAIAVLMPCTYPMIPITISYFTRQAEARKTTALPLALAYGAGIILDFIIIGIVIGPPIIGFAHHWATNTIVAVLFIAFGLSLLGLFELRLPGSLNALASRAAGAKTFAGVFLLGATLVITSFACTAPFMAAVLAGGTQGGSFLEVLVSMFFFGLAMALPFVGLALFPSAVKNLPKSGEWMHTLKVTFGFLVLAAALYFISKVDKTLKWNSLPRELYFYITAGIAFTAALYLFGLIRFKGEGGEIGPSRLVFGMLAVIFTLYCIYGAQGNRLGGILESIAPDYGSERLGVVESAAESKSPWTIVEDDFEGGLAAAQSEGKFALINWTGVNCTNCRAMERTIFTKPEVIREFQSYVELRLHTDRDDALSKSLKEIKDKRLNDISMPIYEIVDPKSQKTIDVFPGADLLSGGKRFREFLARNAQKSPD